MSTIKIVNPDGSYSKVHAPECRCYQCLIKMLDQPQQEDEIIRFSGMTKEEINAYENSKARWGHPTHPHSNLV